ncbi:hypothetical protein G6F43_011598 [Rhizopus delemar]|nr:hypothetical protein G6F43_011598 [Rhizopus delemar]
MLACAQDIFFTSDTVNQNNISDPFLDNQQSKDSKRSRMKHSNTMHHLQHHLKHEHIANKHKEEQQVWPPDVEAAFIEALETIPKLGRRKILVNGKPCGRNELISDFIFRKTQKIRTRKQVSSHIQVLKNTRKNDPHFMRLLTDSADVDEGFATIQQPVRQHQRKPRMSASSSRRSQLNHNQKIKATRSGGSTTSDDSSISSSPSPADYVFDRMYQDQQNSFSSMLDLKDPFFEPFFNSLNSVNNEASNESNNNSSSSSLFDNNGLSSLFSMQDFSNVSADDVLQQLFPLTNYTSESGPTVVDLLEQQNSINNFLISQKQQHQQQNQKKTAKKSGIRKYNKKKNSSLKSSLSHPNFNHFFQTVNPLATSTFPMAGINPINGLGQATVSTWIDPSIYPLWPNYLCLYLEYSLSHDPSTTIPHTLATITECIPSNIASIDGMCVAKEKCPPLSELTSSPALTVLTAKVKLNLNINTSDFFFNNTSFFETRDRRTIECTTTIYSFGNVVLESKEIQQALWINEGKYIYSFAYVNQFFDAFMKGIRSLQSWEEIDIAITNLCVVQVFEDVESKMNQTSVLPEDPMPASTSTMEVTLSDDLLLTDTTQTESAAAATPTPSANHESACIALPNTTSSPLLVMIYEFERGQGTMDIALVENGSSLLETTSDLLISTAEPSNNN